MLSEPPSPIVALGFVANLLFATQLGEEVLDLVPLLLLAKLGRERRKDDGVDLRSARQTLLPQAIGDESPPSISTKKGRPPNWRPALIMAWSGRRDSNPRIRAWEARALPLGDARVIINPSTTGTINPNKRAIRPRKMQSLRKQRPYAW